MKEGRRKRQYKGILLVGHVLGLLELDQFFDAHFLEKNK